MSEGRPGHSCIAHQIVRLQFKTSATQTVQLYQLLNKLQEQVCLTCLSNSMAQIPSSGNHFYWTKKIHTSQLVGALWILSEWAGGGLAFNCKTGSLQQHFAGLTNAVVVRQLNGLSDTIYILCTRSKAYQPFSACWRPLGWPDYAVYCAG